MKLKAAKEKASVAYDFAKKHYGFLLVMLSVFLLIIGIIAASPYLCLLSALIIWFNNLYFALSDIYRHIIFFIFNVAFGIFLLGRFIASGVFGFQGPNYDGLFQLSFSTDVVSFILISISSSLIVLFISYYRAVSFQSEVLSTLQPAYDLLAFRVRTRTRLHARIEAMRTKIKTWLRHLRSGFVKKMKNFENTMLRLFFKNKLFGESINQLQDKHEFKKYLKASALGLYLFTLVFHWIYVINIIVYTSKVGYHGSYLNPLREFSSLIYVIGEMYDISLFAFLILRPTKKEALVPILLYLVDGVLFLASGRRLEFMLNILIILSYYVFRNAEGEERWINKKLVIAGIVTTPILIILLVLIGELRLGNKIKFSSLFDPLLKFFYDQGVSARVIGHTKVHLNELPGFKFYSIGTIIEFIRYKLIGSFILHNPVPVGQSVDRAVNGHLFSQAIAYLAIPDQYLKGVGTGSSYVAELYADFRYVGIIVGSFIYGKLINKFAQWIKSKKFLIGLFSLLMVRGFYLTPRSGYSSFITTAFSLRQIAGLCFVLILAYLLNIFNRYRQIMNSNCRGE